MATLGNIVKYNAHNCSDKINQLKANALKTAKDKKYVHVHADGRVVESRDYKYSKGDGFKGQFVEYDKVVETMSPKNENWNAFLLAKQQAAAWLTAASILKVFGQIPTRKELRKAVRGGDPRLFAHVSKRTKRKGATEHTIFFALDMLEFTVKNPPSAEESATIDAWVAEKTAEVEARRAACQSHS